MGKRKTAILGLACSSLAAIGAVWHLWPNRSVTIASCAHVREGMSLGEVERLFNGCAARNIPGASCRDPEGARGCSEVRCWPGIGGEAQIGFDHGQRVRGVICWRSQQRFFNQVRQKVNLWLGQ